MESIFHARLLLLHLALGSSTDVDDGNTTGELGQTLLELLAVVIRRGLVDRGFDLLDATLDFVFVALTIDEGGVLLIDDDSLGATEIGDDCVLELEADFL